MLRWCACIFARQPILPTQFRTRINEVGLLLCKTGLGLHQRANGLVVAGLLMSAIEHEQQIAAMNDLAALHFHVGHPAGLRRRDESVIALTIAEPWVVLFLATSKQQKEQQ